MSTSPLAPPPPVGFLPFSSQAAHRWEVARDRRAAGAAREAARPAWQKLLRRAVGRIWA